MSPSWFKRLFSRKKKLDRQPEIQDNRRVEPQPAPDRAAYGLKTLYDCDTAEVDIVVVHGLNGHREETFTAANGICWLKSLLPAQSPNIRVLSYGYDARTHSSSVLSREHLHGHAEQLIEELRRERTVTETTRRPIIFLGHSLGGLVIKAALILSASYNESHLPDRKYIKVSTYGVMFLGTPHQGGEGVSWGILATNLASIFQKTNKEILKHLEKNSEWLENQQALYLPISNQFETIYFYETYPTPLPGGGSLLVVPKHSACTPGALSAAKIAILSDHTNMVKFQTAEDDGFRKVHGELSIMLKKALRKVEENWEEAARVENLGQVLKISYSIPMRLPFHQNGNFTGRDRELAEIHKALYSTDATTPGRRIMALYGLGGIGKTQLATQYAYIHRGDYTSVWWVNGSTTQTLSQGFLGIAQQLFSYHAKTTTAGRKPDITQLATALGLPPDVVDQNGELTTSREITKIVVNAIIAWLAAEGNDKWLLIIDNYDDLRNVNIYDFLHPNSSGSILITSRSRDTSRIGKALEVQEVTDDEALEILRKSAQMDMASFQKERSDAEAIVKKLGALPLALDQAGSYVSAMQVPLKKYLVQFERVFAQITAKKPPSAVWQYRDDSVFTTWEVSFNTLSPAAQELLLLFGFFDNHSIPEELLPLERLKDQFQIGEPPLLFVDRGSILTIDPIDSIDDAIREIFSLSLAKRRDLDTIWVHPLVHSWSRERLGQSEKTRKALHAISLVAETLAFLHRTRKVENWVKERIFMPHIQMCFHHICRDGSIGDTETGAIKHSDVQTLADILEYHRESAQAGELYQWIINVQGRSMGEDHPETLLALYSLGGVCWSQGKYEESLKWYRRALTGREKTLGKDHRHTFGTIHEIGNVLWSQGKYDEALEYFWQAHIGQERTLGMDHQNTLFTIHAMANVFLSQGKYDEALEWHQRALAGREKLLGNDHPSTLSAVNSIGDVFSKQGKYDEALEWYKRALAGREKSLGTNHPKTLTTVYCMGKIFGFQGKHDEAMEWYRRALAGQEKSLGKDHPDTLAISQSIAELLQKQSLE